MSINSKYSKKVEEGSLNEVCFKIEIKNIYYMLSYNFDFFDFDEDIYTESDDFKSIFDLFARVLIEGVKNLIKRGFYKEYIVKNEDSSVIRGKIKISESIKKLSFIQKRLGCEFDDFSEDILVNQIIKTTFNNLIRFKDLNKDLKKKLRKYYFYFDNISLIDLDKQVFNSISWNRHNKHYEILIEISRIIHETSLPGEGNKKKVRFKDIRCKEKKMHDLFEKFVLNFYKRELNGFKTNAPSISWNVDNDYHNIGKDAIPKMYTDIVLKKDFKQLIIDTKFYKEIFKSNKGGKKKVNSNHLYQIYSYLKNSKFEGEIKEISGMLLYASIGKDIGYEFKIDDYVIYVKTINLNQDWEKIDNDLREIAYNILDN